MIKNGLGSGHVSQGHENMDCTKANQGNLSKLHELPLVKELFGNPQEGSGLYGHNVNGDGLGVQETPNAESAPKQKENELSEHNSKLSK